MQIVLGDNMHEISYPICMGKIRKISLSTEFAQSVLNGNIYIV